VVKDEHKGTQCWCEGDVALHPSLDEFDLETASLMHDYHGDEPYPDDDHSLGFHEKDPDIKCRQCREEYAE
jgi:hypothetical protein